MLPDVNNATVTVCKGVNEVTIVAVGAVLAGLANSKWTEMDHQKKFVFMLGVAVAVLGAVGMLLDQALKR
jgi:hypothetical protein